MGCCCSKEQLEEDEVSEQTPLLGGKSVPGSTSITGTSPTKVLVPAPNDVPPESAPDQDPANDPVVPTTGETRSPAHDITPASVDLKQTYTARYDELMEAAVSRYHTLLERYQQLQTTRDELRQMYPEYNKALTMDGCFYHVRNTLGDNLADAITVQESNLWIAYKPENVHHSLLPAINTFNKASRLVTGITHEGPQLTVAVDDVIFAEADIRKEQDKLDVLDKTKSYENLAYNLKQLCRVKGMTKNIINDAQNIKSEMQGALGEIKCESGSPRKGGTPGTADDHVMSDTAGVPEAPDLSAVADQAETQQHAEEQTTASPHDADVSTDASLVDKSTADTDSDVTLEGPPPSASLEPGTPGPNGNSPVITFTPATPAVTDAPNSPGTDHSRTNDSLEVEPPTPVSSKERLEEAASPDSADPQDPDDSISTETTNESMTTSQNDSKTTSEEQEMADTDISGITEHDSKSDEDTISEEPGGESSGADASQMVVEPPEKPPEVEGPISQSPETTDTDSFMTAETTRDTPVAHNESYNTADSDRDSEDTLHSIALHTNDTDHDDGADGDANDHADFDDNGPVGVKD